MNQEIDKVENMEPAERNSAAIAKTVIVLVVLMFVGGFVIMYKYNQKMAEESKEMEKGRPAKSLKMGRENFKMKDSKGEIRDFTVLEGKLTLMAVFSVKFPQQSQYIIDEMKLAEERYKGDERLQFLLLSADVESVVSVAEMAAYAEKVGATGSAWVMFTSNSADRVGYFKDQLGLGIIGGKNKAGVEVLPDVLRMVDPLRRIRGEYDDFSFGYYHQVEARTRKELDENPALSEDEKKRGQIERGLNAVVLEREKMYKNIDYMLNVENFDIKAIQKKSQSNVYKVPLYILGAFVVCVVIVGYRYKKSVAAADLNLKRGA